MLSLTSLTMVPMFGGDDGGVAAPEVNEPDTNGAWQDEALENYSGRQQHALVFQDMFHLSPRLACQQHGRLYAATKRFKFLKLLYMDYLELRSFRSFAIINRTLVALLTLEFRWEIHTFEFLLVRNSSFLEIGH